MRYAPVYNILALIASKAIRFPFVFEKESLSASHTQPDTLDGALDACPASLRVALHRNTYYIFTSRSLKLAYAYRTVIKKFPCILRPLWLPILIRSVKGCFEGSRLYLSTEFRCSVPTHTPRRNHQRAWGLLNTKHHPLFRV